MSVIECPSCKAKNNAFPRFKGRIRCCGCKRALYVAGRRKNAELADANSLFEKLRNLVIWR